MSSLDIPVPDVLVSGRFDQRVLRAWFRKARARVFYARDFLHGNRTIILLHMRPQPSTRTERGIQDLVTVLTHETLHWVLDKIEMPASACLDRLDEEIFEAT